MTAATAAATRRAWGQQLRDKREDRGLTQAELAAAAGLDQASVSRAENGTSRFETYLTLARALDVTLEVTS